MDQLQGTQTSQQIFAKGLLASLQFFESHRHKKKHVKIQPKRIQNADQIRKKILHCFSRLLSWAQHTALSLTGNVLGNAHFHIKHKSHCGGYV